MKPRERSSVRRLRAELEVLELFDGLRQRAGHDYGSGQRGAELGRRRRKIEEMRWLPADECEPPTAVELREAFERVGRPRLERAIAPGVVRGWDTPTGTRTIATWERVRRQLRYASEPTAVQHAAAGDELAAETAIEAHSRELVTGCGELTLEGAAHLLGENV